MKPIKPIINLKVRSASSTASTGRLKIPTGVGLFANKQASRDNFRQKELNRQVGLRQKLERATNAGIDSQAKSAIEVKTKQVEQTIGFLQKKD